ncbi:hypothetical protein SRRS_40070 [Sporomusa rhizae]
MQTMMEQLVTMVGHNNAVTEELVQRMDRLETKVDKLETKVDKLETRVTSLETETEKGFTDIIQMISVLGDKVVKIDTAQALHAEMIRTLAADTAQHDAEITLLKRAKVS